MVSSSSDLGRRSGADAAALTAPAVTGGEVLLELGLALDAAGLDLLIGHPAAGLEVGGGEGELGGAGGNVAAEDEDQDLLCGVLGAAAQGPTVGGIDLLVGDASDTHGEGTVHAMLAAHVRVVPDGLDLLAVVVLAPAVDHELELAFAAFHGDEAKGQGVDALRPVAGLGGDQRIALLDHELPVAALDVASAVEAHHADGAEQVLALALVLVELIVAGVQDVDEVAELGHGGLPVSVDGLKPLRGFAGRSQVQDSVP